MEGRWVDFVAGWVSGATSVMVCQPLDTVLTRFQAGKGIVASSGGNIATNELHISSLRSTFRGLAREFGIGSLWRGSSPMIGVVPFQNALLMGGYGIGKQYGESETNHTLIPVFIGGCVGGVLQSFLVSPIEWIKVRQQTIDLTNNATNTAKTSTTTSSLARRMFHPKSRLWHRGLVATLLRDGIPHGVWFASYEYCKVELLRIEKEGVERCNETDNLSIFIPSHFYESTGVPMISGAFAATIAWAVGYPFDIIKTRIQAAAVESSVPGVLETTKQLVVEADGHILRVLYRGFGLKLARSIPASMIGFLAYEVVSNGLTAQAC